LAPLRYPPRRELLVRHVELDGHLVFGDEHAAEVLFLPVVVLHDMARRHVAALHGAALHEWRGAVPEIEFPCGLVGVSGDVELGGGLRLLDGERLGHDARRQPPFEVPSALRLLGVDVDALPPLGKAVLRAVHHAPLDRVAEGSEAREDDREVAAALGDGALEQPVDVLQQDIAGCPLEAEEAVDVPPQDALLALDATRHREGFGHRVVLAWESADDHVDVWNLALSGLELVEHPVDVLVDEGAVEEPLCIAPRRELPRVGSGRLPLVRPYRLELARSREVELRAPRVVVPLQAEPEAADAREEFGHLDGLLRRHVSPISAVSLMSRPS